MGKKIVGTVLGLAMMGLSVGAFLSNEPASKTDQGHIVILVVFAMGLLTMVNGLTAKTPKAAAVLSVPVGPTCPACHKPVMADFTVCPYCATTLKPKCPACGKEVSPDFKNCPYCGTALSLNH